MRRLGTLLEQSYGLSKIQQRRVFDFRRRFNNVPVGPNGEPLTRTGPLRSAPAPFSLVANAPALVVAPADPNREALLIQNCDPVANLFVGFGVLADANGFFIGPLGYLLEDVKCPTDQISVFATANCRGFIRTVAKQG